MKSIAIMQPTFLPWIGYFGMMDCVDEFVLLDSVQFDKRSWQQRNQIKTQAGPLWLTVPVLTKGHGKQTIRDAQIFLEDQKYPNRILKSIEYNYHKAPFYLNHIRSIQEIFAMRSDSLCLLNRALIDLFRTKLDIQTPIIFSSELDVEGEKTALLVDICRARHADHYLSPPTARSYIEASSDFEDAGISIKFFDYNHPEWPQLHGEFQPYMSVLDLIFNTGEQAMDTIRRGYRS